MPKVFEFRKEMLSDFEEIIEEEIEKERKNRLDQEGENRRGAEIPLGIFKSFTKMFDFPDGFGTWSIISGILKLLVSAFFLLASIRLLQMRRSSIKLFYLAAGSSIALGVVKGIVALSAVSFMAIAMMFGGILGIIIDIVLIIVVATGNREAFFSQIPRPLTQRHLSSS